MQTPPRTGKTIQSVQRAIDILNCFDAQTPALSLGEISARLQLNKATVHGLLNTLHNNGYVCQNSRGEYLLGSALFSKASLAGSTAESKLRDAIAQPLQALCDRFQTSGVVCLVQSARLEHLYTAMPHRSAFILQPSAQSGPLYAMASGKLLLAHADAGFVRAYLARTPLAALTPKTLSTPERLREELERIRRRGVSLEQDELAMGVSSIAAPFFDAAHRLYATVSLTGISAAFSQERGQLLDAILELRDTAQAQCQLG